MATVMNAKDAVYGSLAECFITISGKRYNFMQMTEFESTWELNIAEVSILGSLSKGHKAAGGNGTWSGTAHYNQSVIRDMVYQYKQTGVMPYFDIQVTNEDPTSSVGRQTVVHKNCLCDSIILSKFTAGDDLLDEELSGTFEDWEMPEMFTPLAGM